MDGYISRQYGIESVGKFFVIYPVARVIKVCYVVATMNPSVGTSAPHYFARLTEKLTKGFLYGLLNRSGIRLSLPSVVGSTSV